MSADAAIRHASDGGGFELLDVEPQCEPGIKLNGTGSTVQTPLVEKRARISLRPVAPEEASQVAPSKKTCEPCSRYWFTASVRLRQAVTLNHVVSSQFLPLRTCSSRSGGQLCLHLKETRSYCSVPLMVITRPAR